MKKVVVFYGKKGAGKDTCCHLFNELNGNTYKQESFAEAVRQTVWFLFGSKIGNKERIYGAIKEKEEPIDGWEIPKSIATACGFTEQFWSGRRLLQWFGTDVCRTVHSEIWVDIVLEKIKENQNTIITDCRFKNEEMALERLCFRSDAPYEVCFVRIVRKGDDNGFSTHASEMDMQNFPTDYLIENNGTMEELKESISKFNDYCNGERDELAGCF